MPLKVQKRSLIITLACTLGEISDLMGPVGRFESVKCIVLLRNDANEIYKVTLF